MQLPYHSTSRRVAAGPLGDAHSADHEAVGVPSAGVADGRRPERSGHEVHFGRVTERLYDPNPNPNRNRIGGNDEL